MSAHRLRDPLRRGDRQLRGSPFARATKRCAALLSRHDWGRSELATRHHSVRTGPRAGAPQWARWTQELRAVRLGPTWPLPQTGSRSGSKAPGRVARRHQPLVLLAHRGLAARSWSQRAPGYPPCRELPIPLHLVPT
eukprot:scaffold283335_cov30-Tisochrysis_lutea.AAC.3